MSARACPGSAAREGFPPASRRLTRGPRLPPPRPPCRRCGQIPAPDPDGSARRGRTLQALATAGRPAHQDGRRGAKTTRAAGPSAAASSNQATSSGRSWADIGSATTSPIHSRSFPRPPSQRSRYECPASSAADNSARAMPACCDGGCWPTAAAWAWNRRPARAIRNQSQRRSAAATENRNAPTATTRGIQVRACRP